MQDNIKKEFNDEAEKAFSSDADLEAQALNEDAPLESVDIAMETDLALAQSKITELNDAWLRARADLENMRRRSQEDVSNAHKYSVAKFAADLLGVKDSLEMALSDESGQIDSLKNGVDLTLKGLINLFERFQINEINPLGEKLDPHKHQAISAQPSEAEMNTVIAVMQKGYQLHDRILRPAMVVVSSGHAVSS